MSAFFQASWVGWISFSSRLFLLFHVSLSFLQDPYFCSLIFYFPFTVSISKGYILLNISDSLLEAIHFWSCHFWSYTLLSSIFNGRCYELWSSDVCPLFIIYCWAFFFLSMILCMLHLSPFFCSALIYGKLLVFSPLFVQRLTAQSWQWGGHGNVFVCYFYIYRWL